MLVLVKHCWAYHEPQPWTMVSSPTKVHRHLCEWPWSALSQGYLGVFFMHRALKLHGLMPKLCHFIESDPNNLVTLTQNPHSPKIIQTWSKQKRKKLTKPPNNKQQCSSRFNDFLTRYIRFQQWVPFIHWVPRIQLVP